MLGCLSPMAAVKLTQDRFFILMETDHPMGFSSWAFEVDNFSTRDGIAAMIIDIILFNLLGLLIDHLFRNKAKDFRKKKESLSLNT